MKYQSIYEDVQRLYKVTIHALINHPAYVTISPFSEPLWTYIPLNLFLMPTHNDLYYYYLGEDKYAILHYL